VRSELSGVWVSPMYAKPRFELAAHVVDARRATQKALRDLFRRWRVGSWCCDMANVMSVANLVAVLQCWYARKFLFFHETDF
jgi:hypothetical protein